MRFFLKEYYPKEGLLFEADYKKLNRDKNIILIIFIIALIELPVMLFLVKVFAKPEEANLIIVLMLFAVAFVIAIVAFSAPKRIISLRINKNEQTLELKWLRYYVSKRTQLIPVSEISNFKVSLLKFMIYIK